MRGGDIDIDIHKKTSKCSNFYLNHLMKIIFNTFKLTKNMANNISLFSKEINITQFVIET